LTFMACRKKGGVKRTFMADKEEKPGYRRVGRPLGDAQQKIFKHEKRKNDTENPRATNPPSQWDKNGKKQWGGLGTKGVGATHKKTYQTSRKRGFPRKDQLEGHVVLLTPRNLSFGGRGKKHL